MLLLVKKHNEKRKNDSKTMPKQRHNTNTNTNTKTKTIQQIPLLCGGHGV